MVFLAGGGFSVYAITAADERQAEGGGPRMKQHFCFRCKTIDHKRLPKKKFASQGRFAS
jgi:hypothetical protein